MDPFQWKIPLEPGDPFGTPLLIALDSVRVLIIVCGLISVLLTIPAILMAWTQIQQFRLACLGMFSIYVVLTEVQRIGYFGNWRIILATVVAVWTLFSLVAFIQYEGNPENAPKFMRKVLHRASTHGGTDPHARSNRPADPAGLERDVQEPHRSGGAGD